MIRVIGIDEAFNEYIDLVECAKLYKKKSELYDFMLLSSYYQQMLLLGYGIDELITEHLFPSEIIQSNEPFYDILRSSGSQMNISAIASAVYVLTTQGYITKEGTCYKICDFDNPRIIEEYQNLMKLK